MNWEKGKSGNPGGRPRQNPKIRELAQENSQAALQTLISLMKNPRVAPSTRAAAANSILDRAHGRPVSSLELSGLDGEKLNPEDSSPQYLRNLNGLARSVASARLINHALREGKRAGEELKRREAEKLIESVVEAPEMENDGDG